MWASLLVPAAYEIGKSVFGDVAKSVTSAIGDFAKSQIDSLGSIGKQFLKDGVEAISTTGRSLLSGSGFGESVRSGWERFRQGSTNALKSVKEMAAPEKLVDEFKSSLVKRKAEIPIYDTIRKNIFGQNTMNKFEKSEEDEVGPINEVE